MSALSCPFPLKAAKVRGISIILESILPNLLNSLEDGYLTNLLATVNPFYRGTLTTLDLAEGPAYSHYTFALHSTVLQTIILQKTSDHKVQTSSWSIAKP